MDTMLLAVTAISLLAAAVSTTLAWRVLRAERLRTAARVAALAAAAGIDPARRDRRAEAHAEPAEIEGPDGLREFTPATVESLGAGSAAADPSAHVLVNAGALFERAAVDSGSSSRQRRLMTAAAVFALAVVGAGATLFISGRAPRGTGDAPRPPLELVALTHQRTDGLLAVSGVVRNPETAGGVQRIDAEVRVFDSAGILIATRSATLDTASLAAGQESPFTVTLGEAATAARYRVSFASEGTLVPHVDRRTNLPAAIRADAR